MEQNFKKNKIIIIGRTNVGKSTLFNNIINKDISVVTKKKNTTIRDVQVFSNFGKFLINLIDLPGPVIRRFDKNNINKIIYNFLNDSDLILFVLEKDILKSDDFFLLELIKKYKKNVFLLINKIDLMNRSDVLCFINKFKNFFIFKKIIPISNKKKINIDILTKNIGVLSNDSNFYIKDKVLFLKDFVRYSLLSNLEKELPYSINFECYFKKIDYKKKIIFIKLFIKKDIQKKILIGLNGVKIKKIIKMINEKLKILYNKRYFIKIFIQKK